MEDPSRSLAREWAEHGNAMDKANFDYVVKGTVQ